MRVLPMFRPGMCIAAIVIAATVVPRPVALAHEGESHAEPESTAVALEGSERISVSGHSDTFEVVLKFVPFQPGTEVPITAYVLDAGTNEPIRGAKVSGTLSSGTSSQDVTFVEISDGLPGSYAERIKVESEGKLSWLFDITAGDKSDLVAVDGFKPGGGVLSSSANQDTVKSPSFLELTRTQTAFAASIIVAVTAFLMRTARRQPNAAKGKRT